MDTTSVALPATPLVESNPHLMQSFCIDCAQGIHEYATIAVRYGFGDAQTLLDYLHAKRPVRRRIKELRAAWQSDENVEVRARRLAGHALLEAMPSTSGLMFDPAVTPSVRIDAMKAHARIAGLDVPPAAAAALQAGAATGGRFSVQIIFGNAGKAETITVAEGAVPMPEPPTIEGEAA